MGAAATRQKKKKDSIYVTAGRVFAGFASEFGDPNFFKEIKVGDANKSVLVAKVDGLYVAVGSRCPHLGGPLGRGIYRLGRIRCPWHGACFDMITGEMEDFPGYDNLPKYHVTERNECIFVHVDSQRMPDRYIKPMCKMTNKWSKVVILGCGAAGYTCAQTLRQEGYGGRVIMITDEKYFPYDRSKITKFPGAEYKHLKIRSATFFHDNDIEILVQTRVNKVEIHDHKIHFEGKIGPQIEFDMLFVTVGMKPRFYSGNVHGCRMRNIVTITTLDQAASIAKLAAGNSVVLLGSSFIAMELAESLSHTAKHIHIISRHKAPYGIVMGETTGKAILQHFLENVNNVTFYCTDDVYSFQGNSKDEVERVITMKRRVILTTLVIVAIGGLPNTELFRSTPIKLHPVDHSILVNKYMETNISCIFAGGDCCNFPLYIGARDRANITHWQVALTHGKVAALNMLGKNVSVMDIIPYFWTNVFGLSIRYVGYGESYDEVLVYGSLEYKCFCTVYRRRKKFIACCAVGCEPLGTEVAVAVEIRPDWCDEVPTPISERFPGDPCPVEVYHGFKMRDDMHTRDHDLGQYELLPRPLSDKKMIKEQKKDVYFRTPINDEFNYLRDPERPGFDLQMLTMRRELHDQYARETEKVTRYERLSKVYMNNPDDDTMDYKANGAGSPPQFPQDNKPPYRKRHEIYDRTKPYSLRYMNLTPEVKPEFSVPPNQKIPALIRKPSKASVKASVKQDSVKRASVKQASVKQDSVKQPSVEDDPNQLTDKVILPKAEQDEYRKPKPRKSFNPDLLSQGLSLERPSRKGPKAKKYNKQHFGPGRY